MATDYQALLQQAYLTPEQLASPLTSRDPLRTERTTFGQYGIYNDAPILSAARAEALVQPGEVFSDFSHSRGNYSKDLGWSSNSFSGKLARGAAALGVEAIPEEFRQEPESGAYYGLSHMYLTPLDGTPKEPMGYSFIGLEDVAKRFGLDKSQFTPYEKEVEGERVVDSETGSKTKGVLIGGDSELGIPSRPLTRTVTAEEQMYEKLNELSKDYFLYTGDTTIPGQGSEGGGQSFQTALYQKQGDKLVALAPPQAHGGWQNADVYTGGGGFKLSELLQGIAPIAAFAIGAPFLDAALVGGAAAGAGAGGSIGGINLGGAFVPTAGSGASFTLPAVAGAGGSIGGINLGGAFTPTAGSGASFAVPGTAGAGSSLLGPTYAELGLTGVEGGLAGPTYGELGLTGLELGTEASTGAPIFDYSQEVILSPNGNYIPANTLPSEIAGLDESIRIAGEAAIKAAPSISPLQAVNALRGVSGLLGGPQQPTSQGAAPTPQNITPRGQVDYSGILSLLQIPSPRRNMYSLLG